MQMPLQQDSLLPWRLWGFSVHLARMVIHAILVAFILLFVRGRLGGHLTRRSVGVVLGTIRLLHPLVHPFEKHPDEHLVIVDHGIAWLKLKNAIGQPERLLIALLRALLNQGNKSRAQDIGLRWL